MTIFIESGDLILILNHPSRMVSLGFYDATAFVVNVEGKMFVTPAGTHFRLMSMGWHTDQTGSQMGD